MTLLTESINLLRGKKQCPVCMKWEMEKLGYQPAQSRPEQYGFTEYWCGNCFYCKRTEFIVLNSTAAVSLPEYRAILRIETDYRTRFQQDPIQVSRELQCRFENYYRALERDPGYEVFLHPAEVD